MLPPHLQIHLTEVETSEVACRYQIVPTPDSASIARLVTRDVLACLWPLRDDQRRL